MKTPLQVLLFAGENNMKVYNQFADYYNRYRSTVLNAKNLEFSTTAKRESDGAVVSISFSQMEDEMNASLKREILRVAQISDINQFPIETWATHPTLKWATFAVVNAMIDMVLPDSIIASIGLYSDVRTIGWGDSAAFDISSRDIFTVSKAGRNKRITEMHKQYKGQVVVVPEPREMTVFVSLMKVLAGKESLAELVTKMVRSFEVALGIDVYNTFVATMAAVSNTASTGLRVAGYTQDEFVRLAQTVSAWNGGTGVVAIGTHRALAKILPANANYRYDIESNFVKVGYMRNFQGVDIMEMPQVADLDTPFGLKLADDKVWLISPSSQKLVKVVLEGNVLSYDSGAYGNANLIQTNTMTKSWGVAVGTNAVN